MGANISLALNLLADWVLRKRGHIRPDFTRARFRLYHLVNSWAVDVQGDGPGPWRSA